MSSAICFNSDQFKILSSGNGLKFLLITKVLAEYCHLYSKKPFPKQALALHICSTSLVKTVRKGEIARNKQFLLFPQCFMPVAGELLAIFIIFENVVCKLCQCGRVWNLSFVKGLTVSKFKFYPLQNKKRKKN